MRWFNPSQPQTLQAAVILGYIQGVFSILGAGAGSSASFLINLLITVGLIAGAFLTANDRKVGFVVLLIAAAVNAFFIVITFVLLLLSGSILTGSAAIDILRIMTTSVFPVALLLAVAHSHSREYKKIWFS